MDIVTLQAARAAAKKDSDTTAARLISRQPSPPITLIAGTQPSHAVTVTGTVASSNLNDTVDPMLGNQSVSFVGDPATATTFAFRRDITVDMTNKGFVFYVQITGQNTGISKVDIQLPSGDGNFTGIVLGGVAYTSAQQYIKEGEWIKLMVPFSAISTGFRSGSTGTTMNRSAISSIRLRVYNFAGQVVSAKLAGIGTYPEPILTFPNGVISFTYDDTYATQYTAARIHLDKYGYRATIFPILERIDRSAGFLSTTQIKNLHDRSGWEIGAHSLTDASHASGMTGLSPTARVAEIKGMKDWQAANGFADSDSLAYPRGSFDANVIQDVSKHYRSARTVYAHMPEIVGTPYPYRLRSYSLAGWSLTQLKTLVDQAKAGRCWVIFTGHNITDTITDSVIDSSATDHLALIDYIASLGIPVLPIGEIMRTGAPV